MLNALERKPGWEWLFYPALIGLFGVLYTYPVFEGDFFWHLNTGQWIWENGRIPVTDPFSFAPEGYPLPTGSHRIQVVLSQYWLGQLLLYGLWSMAGYQAIILARAACYGLILALVAGWSRRNARGVLPFAALFVVGAQLLRYSNERPQLFGFLLATLLFLLLERLRSTPSARGWQLCLLPLLMLVWANIHGSFLLGVVVCLLYAGIHLLRARFADGSFDRNYFAALLAAAAVTLCNPNLHWGLLEYFGTDDLLTVRTREFQSPLKTLFVDRSFDPYWLLLLPTAYLLLTGWRRMAAEHFWLLALLAAFSLTGGRYVPFFLFASPIALAYLPRLELPGKAEMVVAAAVFLLFFQFNFKGSWQFRESRDFPRQAAAVLAGARPGARVFNHAAWGGYLSRFAPGCKVFLDGRLLVAESLRDYTEALGGRGWRELFARHRVDTVLLPARELNHATMQYGRPVPLIEILMADSEWRLLYQDQQAVVFVRNPLLPPSAARPSATD